MKNPWTKKNPLMSMFLSGANSVANTVRAHAGVQAKRQAKTATNQAAKQIADFWTKPLGAAAPAAKKRARPKPAKRR